jgi:murein DD-endopeptidase MepM/ murein hydrolase activator NlpD
MRERNIQLEQEVKSLQLGLLDINESISSTRVWLESIDRKRTEIEEIENDIYNRRLPRASDQEVYKIVSMANLQTTGLNDEDIGSIIEKLILQIDDLMENASVRDGELESMKERYEVSLEALKYIPSINPANGHFTSLFGYRRNPFGGGAEFHKGADIANTFGTNIIATANGKVTFAARRGGYGLSVSINHGNGLVTTYSHMSKIVATVGQEVNRGDIIGKMGSTGSSTGVHIHYEIIKDGTHINPISYMK